MSAPATILTPADFPAVRAAIDVGLDSAALPDAVIALPIYQGAAERAIAAKVPGWDSLTGDLAARVEAATIYLTAALLCPAVPQLTRETMPDYAYQALVSDPSARAAQLTRLADAELAVVLGETGQDALPTFFTLAYGRRIGGTTPPAALPFSQRLRGASR